MVFTQSRGFVRWTNSFGAVTSFASHIVWVLVTHPVSVTAATPSLFGTGVRKLVQRAYLKVIRFVHGVT